MTLLRLFTVALCGLCAKAVPAEKLFPKPTLEQVAALENTDYGKDTDAIDQLTFAFFNWSSDPAFRAQMEPLLLARLKTGAGTPRHRALLAHLLDAVAERQAAAIRQQAAVESDPAISTRLLDTLSRITGQTKQFQTPEPARDDPGKLPSDARALASWLGYIAQNPNVPVPAWLTLDALDNTQKPKLMHALALRGEPCAALARMELSTPGLVTAAAFWIGRRGAPADFPKIFDKAELLKDNEIRTAANSLAGTRAPGVIHALIPHLSDPGPRQRKLAVATLALLDLSQSFDLIINGFETAAQPARLAVLSVLENVPGDAPFAFVFGKLRSTNDSALRSAAQRALTRMAQGGLSDAQFALIQQAAADATDAADRRYLLRFAAQRGGADGLALCETALADPELVSDALKTLGNWKNHDASTLLSRYDAAPGRAPRERVLAQQALLAIAERVPSDSRVFLERILADPAREQERAAAQKLLDKLPPP